MDIFERFFGGGMFGGGGRERGPRRGEDLVHHLAVTLEDLYNGKTKKVALTKDTICSGCKGFVFMPVLISASLVPFSKADSYLNIQFGC
jgi:DnaJ-class molecular chaperone